MKRKVLSIFLAIVMIVGMVPFSVFTVFAETTEQTEPDYFCITNISEEDATVTWTFNGYSAIKLYYKIDSGAWSKEPLDFTSGSASIALSAGSSVYFQNDTGWFSQGQYSRYRISCNQPHTASGDISTLIKKEGNVLDLTDRTNYGDYSCLFSGDVSLDSAENLVLPATTLTWGCYRAMFYGCTSLKKAPSVLPATTLTEYCCEQMFYGCTSLTEAPALLATTLTEYCCQQMFYGCTSLKTAPNLPATTLAKNCCKEMFSGCTSLTTVPALLPAKSLAEGCYWKMFYGCTSLKTAPALPATTLADACYDSMFYGCTSLTTAPALPATTLAEHCYSSMFYGCTSLETAPSVLPATTLASSCYRGMFYGCTSLIEAPALPATTLAEYCYSGMFYGCTSLIEAPALPATTLAEYCYSSMFYGCTSLTTALDLPASTLVIGCYSGMFFNCRNLSALRVGFTKWSGNWGEEDFDATTSFLNEVNRVAVLEMMCPEKLEVEEGKNSFGNSSLIAANSGKINVTKKDMRTVITGEVIGGKTVFTEHFLYDIEDNYQTGRTGRQENVDQTGEGRIIFMLTEDDLGKIDDCLVITGNYNGKSVRIEVDCAYTYFYNGDEKIEAADKDCAAFAIIDAEAAGIEGFTAYGYYRLYADSCVDEDNIIFAVELAPKNV